MISLRNLFNKNLFLMIFASVFTPLGLLCADDGPTGSLRLDYWTFGVSGEAKVEGSESNIASMDRTLSGENWGITFGGELRYDTWGAVMDLFVGKQSNSKQIDNSHSVDWDAGYTILTAGAFLPFVNHDFEGSDRNFQVDGFAGIRSYMNTYKLQFLPYDPNNNQDRSDDVSWIDPYLGLRIQGHLAETLALSLYGDAGGFGIGHASELSVLTRAEIIWTAMDNFNVIGGYRLFDLKTANENGTQQTELDLRMSGPSLGIEIRFE